MYEWEVYLPRSANVWVTVLTDKYSSLLIEQLVLKGYSVSAIAGNHQLSVGLPGSVSHVIGMKISKNNMSLNVSFIEKEIRECLYNIKAFFYSTLVLIGPNVAWGPGNIVVELAPRGNQPIKTSKPKNHLHLVKNDPEPDKPTGA